MEQYTIVVSGFDRYQGVSVNPSLEVARALQAHGVPVSSPDDPLQGARLNIIAVQLPISFANAWPVLRHAIDAARPDIVIATGLKRDARGIMMERCATNLMDAAKPDADNVTPRRLPIDPQGPAAYWTRLPLSAILKNFAARGIPASLSSDAGTYVCNSLFYHLLRWTADQGHVLAGFVSLPLVNGSDHSRYGLTLDTQTKAGRVVIREAVHYYRQAAAFASSLV